MTMVRDMPVVMVAHLVREADQRLCRVTDHYIAQTRGSVNMSEANAIGVNETSSLRGRDYSTLFVVLDARLLLFGNPGKDVQTITKCCKDLRAHGGKPEATTNVSVDISPAFQKGPADHLPDTRIAFVDRFHPLKLIAEALDAACKGKVCSQPYLETGCCIWLKDLGKLSDKQSAKLQEILKNQNLKTAQAYQLRLTFQEIFTIQNRHQGATLLKAWMENAKDSGLPPLVKVAYTIMNHWDGVLRWFESQQWYSGGLQ